jgi:hypothetical protein
MRALTFLLIATLSTCLAAVAQNPGTDPPVTTLGGTANTLPLFSTASDIENSVVSQSGTGASAKIGIGTLIPATTLDVHGDTTVQGNLNANGSVSGGTYLIGPDLFAFTNQKTNVFLGFAGQNVVPMTGNYNMGIGWYVLPVLESGDGNTATGFEALQADRAGYFNTAMGYLALQNTGPGSVDTAGNNTAVGALALQKNATGSYNTAVGFGAGPDMSHTGLSNSTAIGSFASVTTSNSLVLGSIFRVNGGRADTNVGIGTTAPQSLLHIDHAPSSPGQDVVQISSGGSPSVASLLLRNTGAGGLRLREGVGTTSGYLASSGPLQLIAGDTGSPNFPSHTAMFITPSSRIGVGTSMPDSTLTVNGTADKPGGGSWGTFSDRRLKDLAGNFTSGLSEVMKINPVRYRYKEKNGMGIHDADEHVGLVAQDVRKVIPEAVTRNNKGYLLLNNDPVIWAMLNAIKEQQKQIASLQSQLKTEAMKGAAREARLAELECAKEKQTRLASAGAVPKAPR